MAGFFTVSRAKHVWQAHLNLKPEKIFHLSVHLLTASYFDPHSYQNQNTKRYFKVSMSLAYVWTSALHHRRQVRMSPKNHPIYPGRAFIYRQRVARRSHIHSNENQARPHPCRPAPLHGPAMHCARSGVTTTEALTGPRDTNSSSVIEANSLRKLGVEPWNYFAVELYPKTRFLQNNIKCSKCHGVRT